MYTRPVQLATTKRAATAGKSRGSSRGAASIRGQLRKSILGGASHAAGDVGGNSELGSDPGSPVVGAGGWLGSPSSPSTQAQLHASVSLSASLRMAAPPGDGGAITRPHAVVPTAHVALSFDARCACCALSDSSALLLQLDARDGMEMLPHAAVPCLLLAAPQPGGLPDLCGAPGMHAL